MKTILIVDDDEDVRSMCERKLSDEGYITRTVSSGLEALDFINKNPEIDLIILDVKMSPVNGIQVLEQLRVQNINTPVILHSDYSTYKNNLKTRLADACLVKSYDLTELKEKVKELLTFEA